MLDPELDPTEDALAGGSGSFSINTSASPLNEKPIQETLPTIIASTDAAPTGPTRTSRASAA